MNSSSIIRTDGSICQPEPGIELRLADNIARVGYSLMQAMDLDEIAGGLLGDYDRHNPGMVFADDEFCVTLEQAWELQVRVAALRVARGERVAGYKVGCVSESVR